LNWTAFAVTLLLAVVGYCLRGVSRSGAVAGFVLAYALYAGAGLGAFADLVALFLLTFFATQLGRRRKIALGTAERSGGRTASQVVANVGVASLFAIGYKHFGHPALLAACAAALAEAAADTVSSECGQALSASARLFTTGARVPSGTDGGISIAGTVCGALASLGMALVAFWAGLIGYAGVLPVAGAALAGMFEDSLLGAIFERRGWLNNDAVNLLGTLSAALLACWWIR